MISPNDHPLWAYIGRQSRRSRTVKDNRFDPTNQTFSPNPTLARQPSSGPPTKISERPGDHSLTILKAWGFLDVLIKKAGRVNRPFPPPLETNSFKTYLSQSDDNGSHKITLLPILFGRFWVLVMAIRTTVSDSIIGRHADGHSAIIRH